MQELLLGGTVSPLPVGQVIFTGEGDHSFIVPSGVREISFVMVSSGGRSGIYPGKTNIRAGGAGGNLAYRSSCFVVPGSELLITISHQEAGLNTILDTESGVVVGQVRNANGVLSSPVINIPGQVSYRGGQALAPTYDSTHPDTTSQACGGGGAAGYAANGGNGAGAPLVSSISGELVQVSSSNAFGGAGSGGGGRRVRRIEPPTNLLFSYPG